jgi:hypothetical protein
MEIHSHKLETYLICECEWGAYPIKMSINYPRIRSHCKRTRIWPIWSYRADVPLESYIRLIRLFWTLNGAFVKAFVAWQEFALESWDAVRINSKWEDAVQRNDRLHIDLKNIPRYMTVKKQYLVASTIWQRKELTTKGARNFVVRTLKHRPSQHDRSSVLVSQSTTTTLRPKEIYTHSPVIHLFAMAITRFICSYGIFWFTYATSATSFEKIFHHVNRALWAKIQMLNLMASSHDWVLKLSWCSLLNLDSGTSGPLLNSMKEQERPIVYRDSRWIFSGSHSGS